MLEILAERAKKNLCAIIEFSSLGQTFVMDIFIASILGTVLGLALAYGGIGQRVSNGLFISARKVCNLETPVVLNLDGTLNKKTEAKIDSDKT
jgi:hypothetical protein